MGVFGSEVMLCVGAVRIGPARQTFWAVWDRRRGDLRERTGLGARGVRLEPGRLRVYEREVEVDLRLEEQAGIECICPSGQSYAWTRKQGGVRAHGRLRLGGRWLQVDGRAVIDDTAGYHERHTSWRWSAGVGTAESGAAVAWNLVVGVNDPTLNSERTVWIDGRALEAPPCVFAADLSRVDDLSFHPESVRERHENRLLVRSRYRQPFGTFSGSLPSGDRLRVGYGVMEEHDVWW